MYQDILRDELEYKGVIMTDAMNMKAITDNYSSGEAAVKAIQAGVDLIVMPDNYKEAYKAIEKALKSGKIKESRIDKSVRRIIYTKLKARRDPSRYYIIKRESITGMLADLK